MKPQRQQVRILIAVPDGATLDTLARVSAERSGGKISCASTGTGALALDAIEAHDAIVVGHPLPDMSAVEFISRSQSRRKRPAVVIAANPSTQVVIDIFRAGAVDVLPEPVPLERFLSSLDLALRRQARHRRRAQRAIKQRRLVQRVLADRRDLNRRIELICRDVVAAHRRLFLRVVSGEPFHLPRP